MSYKRALEEEEKQKIIDAQIAEQIQKGSKNSTGQEIQSEINENENITNALISDEINKLLKGYISKETKTNKNKKIKPKNKSQSEKGRTRKKKKQMNTIKNRDITYPKPEEKNKESKQSDISDVIITKSEENERSVQSDVTKDCDENDKISETEAENVQNMKESIPISRQPVILPDGAMMPPPRVETVDGGLKSQHLTHEELNDYCKKLFKFKTANITHFK